MLCDSVGITPAPNNGTLRLPLKPIGLHDDSSTNALDTPPDPVQETHTISTAPAPEQETHTISTAPAPQPTNPIQVNPVTTSSAEQSTQTIAVGVDQPVPQPQPTDQHSGSDSDDSGSDNDSDSDSDDDDDGSAVDKVKGFWDWFTGKVDKWWGKVTGHGKGGEEAGGEAGGNSSE
jgi:hypothetical protein